MPNFNRLASVYDFLKQLVFGNQLEKASQYFLNKIPENSNILIIGGGTGKLLQCFNSSHQIIYVEQSTSMIRKAKRVKTSSQIEFIAKDILKWESTQKFDVIVTPFVLDCFNENQLHSFFQKLVTNLKKEAIWIQTDFYPKTHRQKLFIKIMYFFFGIFAQLKNQTLPNFEMIFKKFNFSYNEKASFYHSMVESKIYRKIE